MLLLKYPHTSSKSAIHLTTQLPAILVNWNFDPAKMILADWLANPSDR